ncbi:MAG: hypothetical protein GEV13_03310 [Rhodospirillales bacterium]|nr:hypothetical protein [Rhodospirillales bacterium]
MSNSNEASNPTPQNATRAAAPVTNPTTTPNNPSNPNNPNPPPSGPTRTSQTLTGFAGGLVVITRGGYGEGNASYSSSPKIRTLNQGSTVSITTDAANNQAVGTIVVPGLRGGTATLQVGGPFVDDKTYTMLTDPARPSTFQTGANTQPLPNETVLVNFGAVPGCTCEYLTWGLWASSFTDPRNSNKSYATIGHYVAGKLTTAVQMPTTGSATYSGSMAGLVRDHGNTRFGTGSFQLNWNFASRSGNFGGGFDNRNFSGAMNAHTGTPQSYSGSVSGPGVIGGVNGGFAASPTDPAAYTLGNFSLKGSQYRASGIFAGQR